MQRERYHITEKPVKKRYKAQSQSGEKSLIWIYVYTSKLHFVHLYLKMM